ncbi:hypothetical protein PHMEG_00024502 [Phytophthora megakarya]|uniref:Uncharacterized protein n=1 Tax=Phytophthora megakarya TaxID=4795 RepID=A0A225VF31_9STRA|nr:hypothetical protein PHMEG_00024502 [Phytophthora megakarya]
MIYEPSSDDIKVENTSSETFVQNLDGKTRHIHAIDSDILTKTKKKRVHFEDEVPEGTVNAEATEAVN